MLAWVYFYPMVTYVGKDTGFGLKRAISLCDTMPNINGTLSQIPAIVAAKSCSVGTFVSYFVITTQKLGNLGADFLK